jgi:hypothetical protein
MINGAISDQRGHQQTRDDQQDQPEDNAERVDQGRSDEGEKSGVCFGEQSEGTLRARSFVHVTHDLDERALDEERTGEGENEREHARCKSSPFTARPVGADFDRADHRVDTKRNRERAAKEQLVDVTRIGENCADRQRWPHEALGITATPGSSSPSRSSSAAPPPVESQETLSARPSSLSARAESAPPTIE